MIGQRHYLIACETDGKTQFWRGRRGQHVDADTGWTYDITVARSYRRPHDALRAARHLESASVEVVEVESVVARVVYRVHVEAVETEN